jgi:hypothetical protein
LALTHHRLGEQAGPEGFSTLYLGDGSHAGGGLAQLTLARAAGMAARMSHAAIDHPGPALLAQEARVTYGPVPPALGGQQIGPGRMLLDGDSFLLRSTTGYGLFYAKGQGVTVERGAGADPAEQELWLNGSVYAAIAAIHGFLPFHASAVAWRGQVFAFSGPSGAGKSTLAAALGQHGLPLFCDDTLVLDVSDPERILCQPGHKRLKLAPDALALTGSTGHEPVAPDIGKLYAEPAAGTLRAVLPLAGLVFLADGAPTAFTPIEGAARIARLNDDHYTHDLFTAARAEAIPARFDRIARIAARIAMTELIRPRDPGQFAATTALVASWIKESPRS